MIAVFKNPAGFIREISCGSAELGFRQIWISGSGKEKAVDIGKIAQRGGDGSYEELMNFSFQLQSCFQLAGNGGANTF